MRGEGRAKALVDCIEVRRTLAVGLGCFPFDYETYLTQSDSRLSFSGI